MILKDFMFLNDLKIFKFLETIMSFQIKTYSYHMGELGRENHHFIIQTDIVNQSDFRNRVLIDILDDFDEDELYLG